MLKIIELKNELQKLNGKIYTPSKLKKEIENIVEQVMGANDVPFNWYKFSQEDEYEFSGFFHIDGSDDMFEILADYSGEVCKVELRSEE